MKRSELIGISVAVVLLVVGFIVFQVLGLLELDRRIGTAQVMEIVIFFVLVLVTLIYAKRTAEIAKATDQQTKEIRSQADASVRMAKEMREQTKTLRETISMSIRPFVSLEVISIREDDSYPFAPPREILVELQSTGKGPATNLVLTCEGHGKKVEYSQIELSSLNVGDKESFSLRRTTTVSDNGVRVAYVLLLVDYNDELGDMWRKTLQIDKNDGWKPGEVSSERLLGDEQ